MSDEHIDQIANAIKGILENTINTAVIANDIGYIKDDLKEIKNSLDSCYLTKNEFEPVKKLVYGLVAVTMVAVIGALLALILK